VGSGAVHLALDARTALGQVEEDGGHVLNVQPRKRIHAGIALSDAAIGLCAAQEGRAQRVLKPPTRVFGLASGDISPHAHNTSNDEPATRASRGRR
jgi:hypothetical protein